MRVYVIRHGETDLNKQGILYGNIDAPLNQNGIDLAIVTGKALAEVPFDVIYSSPLIRAMKTAELIAAECETAQNRETPIPIIQDARLRELQFGDYELKCVIPGKRNMEDPENFDRLNDDPFHYVPRGEDGESVMDLIERTGAFWKELMADRELADKTVLISMHGCSSRGLLFNVHKNKEDYWLGGVPGNCAVSIIDITDGKASFVEKDRLYYDPTLCINHY